MPRKRSARAMAGTVASRPAEREGSATHVGVLSIGGAFTPAQRASSGASWPGLALAAVVRSSSPAGLGRPGTITGPSTIEWRTFAEHLITSTGRARRG
jgi:hypothetical protein